MRSIGGGVGLPHVMPFGSVAARGVGLGTGVGLAATIGVLTGVGVEGSSDPHETSARPVAAQTNAHASFRAIESAPRLLNWYIINCNLRVL